MKRILVVFGSTSDKAVYLPWVSKLEEAGHKVIQKVISAHRNPIQLGEVLAKDDFDLVVAGAGLAAHLPGVVASRTYRPVLGIPVAAQFQGLDAFASIVQMPFGVPVVCVHEKAQEAVISLLKKAELDEGEGLSKVIVVMDEAVRESEAYLKKWPDLEVMAQALKIQLTFQTEKANEGAHLFWGQRPSSLGEKAWGLYVPYVDLETVKKAEGLMRPFFEFEEAKNSPLPGFVGVNNLKNGLLALMQLKGVTEMQWNQMKTALKTKKENASKGGLA